MKRTLIGVLTPSSNTALEPLTSAIVAGLPGVSAHFARFRVTEISLGAGSQGQFELAPILDAARLLADARVEVIVWSGTSAGWLGFERDTALCAAIERETGVPACTSVLAFNEVAAAAGQRRFGLVTPYLDDVQARIVANYRSAGFECVAERHTGQCVNFEFAEVDAATLTRMVREVAASKPDCITTFCTNLRAAQLVPAWEAELGIPVYDTVSTAVWKALRTCGVDPAGVVGWGRLFSEVK
jgi:maleate isomerase